MSDRPTRPKRLVHSEIEATAESIVYDPDTRKVTVLNPVAGAIWLLCDGTRDRDAICDWLAQSFPDTPRGQIVEDVTRALRDFVAEGLLDP